MKRYYAQVETEFGTCTLVVKNEKVKNVHDARNHLTQNKDYKFLPEQILSISEERKLNFDMMPENIDYLITIFDEIATHNRKKEVCVG